MATIAEFSWGFPGISTRIPFENGFICEVLLEHGYNTYCVGTWHLTPGEETGMADDTELSGINPRGGPGVTGPDGQPWPLLDTVRPWESFGDDEKRLFIRMAEVFAGYVEYGAA